mmetsp:Transcript_70292/g.187286  ORF Transcript_70292/g.187286 Transcript_70292/m.187286 type:complete len:364 (-) Transcript_70292:9-1100(-)
MATLEAIKYKKGELQLLDQLKLPFEFEYMQITNCEEAWKAIRAMNVRGAPAIAIAAALALAVESVAMQAKLQQAAEAKDWLISRLEYLKTSRPTAVNLFNDCDRLAAFVKGLGDQSAKDVLEAYANEAEKMLAKDISDNMAIGKFGGEAILARAGGKAQVKVLTHCNTGSLATARYGTALGVIRFLHESGRLERAFCTETRPYNQGCRLTAFELVFEKIPATLITDSMASYLMAAAGGGGIDAVVVGADRVVANGDTANKIGTYQLAIAAKHHGVGFFVAVPLTSIDVKLKTGAEIHIEQRPADELTCVNGKRVAAEGIEVWNPGFDVTPAALIDGLITEHGVITKAPGSDVFDVAGFVAKYR